MATSFPTYPATTFEQAVELAIFSSNQLHNVINGGATSSVETEDGNIPTIRYALTDNFYFKTPIAWVEGDTATVFNQLYYINLGQDSNSFFFAPDATTSTPVTLGSTPVGDNNWRYYGYDFISKSALAATTGAALVGTSDGSTVQSELDSASETLTALRASSGFNTVGQCDDYAALRLLTPTSNGQQVKVRSSLTGWKSLADGVSYSPLTFVYLSWMTVTDYPDDGGTIIAAADGVSVWVNTEILKKNEIDVMWFGATNDYATDSTTAIQDAITAASFWAETTLSGSRGLLGHRWTVLFPQKCMQALPLQLNQLM